MVIPGTISVDFHDYPSMIEAFRAIKDHIAISNDDLDALCNFGSGHTDKLLGPTSVRGFARNSLDAMIWALAVKGTFTIDVERAKEMAQHWEQRCASNTRVKPNRISKKLVKAAQPIVVRENGRLGGMVRAYLLSPKQVSDIARKGGKSRKRKLSRRERKAIALHAVKIRWSKPKHA